MIILEILIKPMRETLYKIREWPSVPRTSVEICVSWSQSEVSRYIQSEVLLDPGLTVHNNQQHCVQHRWNQKHCSF